MIRAAVKLDQPALEELYNLCFPGEPGFCRWFFDHVYQPENTLVLADEGVLISALQMLPVVLGDGKRQVRCGYLYAVGTRPEYRGAGRMARLIEASFAAMRERGDALAVLITQEPSLIRYYARFGFRPLFARECRRAEALPLPRGYAIRGVQEGDLAELDVIYQRACTGIWHPVRRHDDWICILRQYGAGVRVLTKPDGGIAAYALLEENGQAPCATEAAGADSPILMAAEAARLGAGASQWYAPSHSGGEENGCAQALTAQGEEILGGFAGHGYLNVLFN